MKKAFLLSASLLLAMVLLSACSSSASDSEEEYPLRTPSGLSLCFINRPAEMAYTYENGYDLDTTCADLYVLVSSAPNETQSSQCYSIDGDKEIEQQIRAFIDPNGTKYRGGMAADLIEYTTEVCKSIRIMLYDKNDSLKADITDLARFYYLDGECEQDRYFRLIINSEKKLLGVLEIGSTIKEYLSFHPMLLTQMHFMFPGLDRSTFENGNYAKVEIELGNGTTLVTHHERSN